MIKSLLNSIRIYSAIACFISFGLWWMTDIYNDTILTVALALLLVFTVFEFTKELYT